MDTFLAHKHIQIDSKSSEVEYFSILSSCRYLAPTSRKGTNLARPDGRTIDDGRASKCEQKMGISFG